MNTVRSLLVIAIATLLLTSCGHKPSTEELNDFKTMHNSYILSNQIMDEHCRLVKNLIEHSRKDQPEKIEKLYELMEKVHAKSEDMSNYIATLCAKLNAAQDEADPEIGTRLLAEGEDGEILKSKLIKYRSDIEELIHDTPLPNEIPVNTNTLNRKEGEKVWQMSLFNKVPKAAAIAILDKYANDVKLTESLCVDRIAKESPDWGK